MTISQFFTPPSPLESIQAESEELLKLLSTHAKETVLFCRSGPCPRETSVAMPSRARPAPTTNIAQKSQWILLGYLTSIMKTCKELKHAK